MSVVSILIPMWPSGHKLVKNGQIKETRKVTYNLDLRYDGRFEVLYQGRTLPYRVYNKSARVQQSDVVSSKRLDAVLAHVKENQDAGKAKTYVQRRRRTGQSKSVISAPP